MPVDWIMCVLEKIETRLEDDSVDELWSAVRVEVVLWVLPVIGACWHGMPTCLFQKCR